MHANRKHPSAARALGALACLALALGPRVAGAQCGYTALTAQVPVTVANSPAFYTFDQSPRTSWMGVAVKSPSGADWDISLWQGTDIYPTCVSTQLAGSALGYGVDFVVGDYNHNPAGVRYVEVNRYSGTGDGTLEWSANDGIMPVNGPLVTAAFGAPVYIYEVYLEAGRTYDFVLQRTAVADIHMLLFRNATGGTCWKGRSAAEWDATVGTTTYTAPNTGLYGLVVVKDDAAMGDARVRVAACMPSVALGSGEPRGSILAQSLFSFDQQQHYWTAVGLRGPQYWAMSVYRSDPGTPIGACFADELASTSSSATSVGVVVGDFDYNATGTYFVNAHYPYDYYTGPGDVQWDDGADALLVNGMIQHGTMGDGDIVRVWDVRLEGGTPYHFTFGRSGADLKLLLFRNPGSGEYWAGRGSQVLTATADADYTAPATGYYGVVVVNDDAGTGEYAIGVGTCSTPAALDDGVPYPTFLGENYVQFDQSQAYWTVIGVRGGDLATDWDMVVQGNTSAAFPDCHGPNLGVSAQAPPTLDFVVGDFNHNATGTYHAWPHTWYGEGSGTGTVLWNRTRGQLVLNAAPARVNTGPEHFVYVWDVLLTAGVQYDFYCSTNVNGHRLMLFRNPASGTYWAPRGSAELDIYVPGPSFVDQAYDAPVTDWYGLVLVNDGSSSGYADVSVGACVPPSALSAGTSVGSPLVTNFYSFAQGAPFWTAVGARCASPSDLNVWASPGGLQYPDCFMDMLAVSRSGTLEKPGTAVVAGDFNHDPLGTYFVGTHQISEPGAYGTVEWDSGPDFLTVGAAAVERTTGPGDVVEAWDCWLQPQKFYTFNFTHTGTADLKLLIFRNPSGGVYWAPREYAEAELPATATWRTTGTEGDYYGLVVVNDNGEAGTYSLRVTDPGTADAEESLPVPTALAGVRPNPARGGVSIAFGLREAATVAFDVLDLSGRRVAVLPARDFDAGERATTWDGRGDAGARLPAGLYFVRMTAGGRVVGTTRVALLD
jgi:hypothetical protein